LTYYRLINKDSEITQSNLKTFVHIRPSSVLFQNTGHIYSQILCLTFSSRIHIQNILKNLKYLGPVCFDTDYHHFIFLMKVWRIKIVVTFIWGRDTQFELLPRHHYTE